LQSSLNFDEGGEIAENLFRLYEYARQQLLTAAREGDTNGAVTAIEAIESIREAWSQIDGSSKVQPSGEAAE
jgi:flagellar protein FliS